MKFSTAFFLFFLFVCSAFATNPLQPVKLDNPRDTMESYLDAMSDYKKGLKSGDTQLKARLSDAARCFDLEGVPLLARQDLGNNTALLLKEILDRHIIVDLERIPEDHQLKVWRLKDSEIKIYQVSKGELAGQFLFSPETVRRIPEFYDKIKHLPYLKGSGQGVDYKAPWQERVFPRWANEKVVGLAKWQWLGLFASILIGLILKVVVQFILRLFQNLTSKLTNSIRHLIFVSLEKPIGLLAASGFWFFGIHQLKLEGLALTVFLTLVQITFSISLVWAAYKLTDVLTSLFTRMAERTESDLDDHLVPLVAKTLRFFVLTIGILMTIQNLGFNVMSLLAGLGLGGLAFALAAKDTAANFFGSLMIIFDRPFKVGDWVKVTSAEGTVEEIGFRSTRIRTFYNSLISVPNSALANADIDNMGERRYRRAKTTLGITYDTSPVKVKEFVAGIKKIISEHPQTRKDYFHVVFNSYGDFSLNILVYFFFETDDWGVELKAKEEVYLAIMELAEKINVSFAFPTQSLHLESVPGGSLGALK